MSLSVTIKEKEKGLFVVTPVGEMNSETAPELQAKINPILNQKVIAILFNLKDLTYISSLGLAVLFKIKAAIKKDKGSLVFCNTPANIQKVFEAIKFMPDQMFTSIEKADAYLDTLLDAIQKQRG